jgi:UbiD family decarboxylase
MRAYMERLRARGELLEVEREVDPKQELAAVTAAAQKRLGKPILFHKVKGTTLPVLANIYGARERLSEILGIGPLEFCRQWSKLAQIANARDVPLRETTQPDTTLAQWKQSIKAIDTAYVKQHGYGVATPERVQASLDFVGKAMKLDAKLGKDDVYVPMITSR